MTMFWLSLLPWLGRSQASVAESEQISISSMVFPTIESIPRFAIHKMKMGVRLL